MVPSGDAVWRRAGPARALRAFGQWEAAHSARARTTEGPDAMTRLSDTQSCLLSAAANRSDRSLFPLPDGLKARGVVLQRTLAALLRRGLIVEISSTRDATTWRTGEEDRRIGLALTDAGLAVIGIDPVPDPAENGNEIVACDVPRTNPARPNGKLELVLSAIEATGGATLEDLAAATGWLPHTTRAAITRLRQRGFKIELTGARGARRYGLADEAA